jgi:GTP-binding protein LepA
LASTCAGAEQDRLARGDPENAITEIEDVIGIDATDATRCSAKTGLGVDDVLEALIAKVPPPKGDPEAPLQALIIDSWFDNYVGVVMLVRIFNGTLRPKDKIRMMATDAQYPVEHIGVFTPKSKNLESLSAGQVGFIIAGIKELQAAKVGDTVTLVNRPARPVPLPGFKEVKPQVFAGLYPVEANQYDALRDSLEKLKLNDARCTTSRKFRRRLASASVAASLVSCTWRSCRSASNASSTWT